MQPLRGNLAPLTQASNKPFVPSDLANLALWLKADALSLNDGDAVESGSDNQIAGLLNAPRYPAYGKVEITPVLVWLAKYGIMPRLRAATSSANQTIAGMAEVAILLVNNPNIPALDVGLPEVQQMLTALVMAGVVPMEASEELLTTAAIQRSRAEILGLGTVTADQVAKALEV